MVENNSVAAITKACPNVQIICSKENLGFAGGTNLGIQAAQEQSNAPMLLLNNDAIIDETDAARLLQTLQEHPEIGVIGPLLFTPDKQTLIAVGGKNPVLHHKTRVLEIPTDKTILPVDYVIGAAALIRSEVFSQVGLLDEDYFFSIEVADLCKRAKKQGYTIATDIRACAFHELNRSSRFRNTLYVYYSIRNRFIYIRKFYKLLKVPLISFWAFYSLALFTKLQMTQKVPTARAVRLGLTDGLQQRYGRQNERVCRNVER